MVVNAFCVRCGGLWKCVSHTFHHCAERNNNNNTECAAAAAAASFDWLTNVRCMCVCVCLDGFAVLNATLQVFGRPFSTLLLSMQWEYTRAFPLLCTHFLYKSTQHEPSSNHFNIKACNEETSSLQIEPKESIERCVAWVLILTSRQAKKRKSSLNSLTILHLI